MIYEQMLVQSKQLAVEIQKLQEQLEQFPEGTLSCAKNGSHYKWYQTKGTTQTYIPKNQRKLAEQLALKKYLSFRLKDLMTEFEAIQSYLKKHREETSTVLLQKQEYDQLLKPYFRPISEELQRWANEPYEKNLSYPEQLIHKCTSGILVRSKSEAFISTFLHIKKIPFRYECALHLKEVTLHPDFTLRHTKTGKVYYWEHFGMMDQPSYAKNTCSKLQIYISNGIIPSIQLITTYETKEQPLSAKMVEHIVQQYFM